MSLARTQSGAAGCKSVLSRGASPVAAAGARSVPAIREQRIINPMAEKTAMTEKEVFYMKGIVRHHGDTFVQDLGGGNTRRILAWNDQLMAVEVGFDKGTVGADHTHPHTQCSYVLSGKFSYSVEGEAVELNPGDSIIVPSGLVHGTVCLEAGTLLDIFTPCREDFLKK